MNVQGKFAMVFKNEKDDRVWYNISDSSKDKDGNYVNKSYNARFLKGQEPTDRSKINYEGFMTYYAKDEKTVLTTIQIMKWDYVEQQAPSVEIKTDELPF